MDYLEAFRIASFGTPIEQVAECRHSRAYGRSFVGDFVRYWICPNCGARAEQSEADAGMGRPINWVKEP